MIFAKPSTSIIYEGETIQVFITEIKFLFYKAFNLYLHLFKIPHGFNGEMNHECELGVIIGKPAKFVSEEKAMEHVLGYVLALDMTASLNMQEYSMLLIKGFDTACPLGKFLPKESVPHPDNISLKLLVNGEVRHDGNTKDLIWTIPMLISYLSQYFNLEYGDLILTGTPSGIAKVKHGDLMEASLGGGVSQMKFNVAEIGK